MNFNLTIYAGIARQLNNTFAYTLLFVVFLCIYKHPVNPLCLIGIPIILLGYMLIERYCYHLFFYLLLHGLFWIPVFFIPFPTKIYLYSYLFLLINEGLHALFIWSHNVDRPYEEAPWYLLLFAAITYFIAIVSDLPTLQMYSYYLGMGMILIHFIRLFISGLIKLISQSERVTSMPTKKIVLTNSSFLLFFILCFIVLTSLIRLFELDYLIYAIGDILLFLVKWIATIIIYAITILRAIFATNRTTEETVTSTNLSDMAPEFQKNILLDNIITWTLQLFLIALAIFILYKIVSYFIGHFLTRFAKDDDIVVSLAFQTERTKKQTPSTSFWKKIKERFSNDLAVQIRRAYRTKIQSYKEKVYEPSSTTSDIANNVMHIYEEDISALTQTYQKARYSNEPLKSEDFHNK